MTHEKIHKWSEIGHNESHAAYLDLYSSLGASIWLLQSGEFNLYNFLEFCNFLEAIVIYDRIIVSPNPFPPVDDLVANLVKEDVLWFIRHPDMPSEDQESYTDTERLHFRRFDKMRDSLRRRSKVECVEAILGIGAHTIHGMQIHPSLYNRAAYLDTLEVEQSLKATYSLMTYYEKLSKAAQTGYEQAAKFRCIESVFIPPVPAIILSKVSSLSEVPEELMHLREKFRKVRGAFREYRQTIRNEEVPLKDSLNAQARLKVVLAEISAPYESKGVGTIAEWKDLTEAIPEDLDIEAQDVKSVLGFLLGKPLEVISKTLRRRKFLQLYSLKKNFFSIRDLDKIIERLWGYSLTESDVTTASQYVVDEKQPTFQSLEYIKPPKWIGV